MAAATSRRFNRESTDLRAIAPATRAAVCVPAATVADSTHPEGATLYVGTGGDISAVPWANESDTPVLFKNVPAGPFDVRLRAVLAADTTADDLVSVW